MDPAQLGAEVSAAEQAGGEARRAGLGAEPRLPAAWLRSRPRPQ
ncbi:hypothetical protein ACL02O_30940 [Micromonospora sp. MS34]